MTRLFLAAGVAALAISAPAAAKPGGGHGGGGQAAAVEQGGGGGHGHGGGGGRAAVFAGGGGGGHGGGGGAAFMMGGGGGRGHGGGGFAVERQAFAGGGGHGHGGGGFAVQRQFAGGGGHGHGGGFAVQRQQHGQRFAAFDRGGRGAGHGNAQVQRMNHVQAHGNLEHGQVRAAERQQFHGNRPQQVENRLAARNELRQNRITQVQNGVVQPREFRNNGIAVREANNRVANGYGIGGCPPGLMSKGCMPPGQALNANRIADEAFRASTLGALTLGPRTPILSPFEAERFVGAPLSVVNGAVPLMALPGSVSYLYPDTPDYYYRYGDGYLYQVDRSTALVDALLPLLGGGFLPGSYLPNYYMSSPYYGMNSYLPAAYGFNSFYPDYGDTCYRYGNGVVYETDCFTGLVEDVIPMYAGGYGVGQLIPSSYGYYNVPMQYRSLYYDTPDYNYWYAPGAIYQYDPGSSMITSVAALLSPGFTIGQPLPMGYDVYNVPYGYRATYYDTPTAWYRYNNGYIYQVDPVTRLVTAIVASILT